MKTVFINIKELLQVREPQERVVSGRDMKVLPTIKNAFLVIQHDRIIDYGKMDDYSTLEDAVIVDCTGKMIFPSWCDSHTHIVYAGNREGEFVDRINGLSYAEIANRGGGILNSAKKLQATSEEDLYEQSVKRLKEVIGLGTGAVEIKSGYGLTKEAEIKMLRVITRLKQEFDLPIKATFLGAHALPPAFKDNKSGYIDYLIEDVLPEIVESKLADYIDIFCETGYFDLEDTERILKAGLAHDLPGKIHVNQFTTIGGVEVGVNNQARSVDHLEVLDKKDVQALIGKNTIPVALPTCSFFLGIPYTPARELIEAGLPLALATDFNPGSTPSGNMNFVVATACIKMNMTPEEAINAATLNGAHAMDLSHEVGSITRGKLANFFISKPMTSYAFLPYAFGSPLIDQVWMAGKIWA